MHRHNNSHTFECITRVTCIIRMKVNVHKNIMFVRLLASVNMQWLDFTRPLVY